MRFCLSGSVIGYNKPFEKKNDFALIYSDILGQLVLKQISTMFLSFQTFFVDMLYWLPFCLIEVRAMVAAVQQPSAERASIFTVRIV